MNDRPMDDIDLERIKTGQRTPYHSKQITGTRHWAYAVVTKCTPLATNEYAMIAGRALIIISNTDNGKCGMTTYGNDTFVVNTLVEMFEFQLNGRRWLMDYRVIE